MRASALAPNGCCGRPLISQGLLDEARARAAANTDRLYPLAAARRALRLLRAELPVGGARGRAVAAARRRAAPGAARRRRVRAVRGIRSKQQWQDGRRRCRSGRGPATDRAPRPLPPEVDGAAARRRRRCCRASPAPRSSISTPAAAAWPDRSATPREHFDVSRADRRAAAAAGGARARRATRCSSRAASRAGTRSQTSPRPGRCTPRSCFDRFSRRPHESRRPLRRRPRRSPSSSAA